MQSRLFNMVKAPFVVPALTRHTASVIMLHGLGDSGAGWLMLGENWRRRHQFDEVSFIFPNAPMIPITINMGMRMPGWYDIKRLSPDMTLEEFQQNEDEPGTVRSREYVNSLIAEEVAKGISPSRIVVGGFSQGGALSLFTGLSHKERLAGIFALSAYVPFAARIRSFFPGNWPNNKTPIFQAHGDSDFVVPYELGEKSSQLLKEMGMDVTFKTYKDMGHSADPTEIEDLEAFLKRVLPPAEGTA